MSRSIFRPFLAWREGLFVALLLALSSTALAQVPVVGETTPHPPLSPEGRGSDIRPPPSTEGRGVDLGTIVVEDAAPAPEAPQLDRAAAATVIIPAAEPDPTATIPDLLEESAGVHLKRYGGLDDFSALSLRGSTSAQVQIYLDDVPLVSAQGDLVDLSLLPTSAIDRIEVYRGGSPGMVPDATAGGVVILRTKEKLEKPRFAVLNTGGSFTTYRGTIDAAKSFGKFSAIAAYDRFQSAGDFPYRDNNGTTFNRNDDRIVDRQNNDFAQNSLFTKLLFAPDGHTGLSFSNVFFQKDQGIPGVGNFQSLTARLQTWRNLAAVAADRRFASVQGLSGHADVFFDFLNSQFRDPQNQIGLGLQDNDDDTYRFGENARVQYELGTHQLLKGFVAHRAEFFLPVNHAASPPDGPHSYRNTISAGAEDEILLFRDRLLLAPSVRLTNVFNDLSNQDPSTAVAAPATNRASSHQLSAKLGVRVRLVDELYLKGNVYRGFRNPTFSELFGDRGTIVGNPGLQPEKSFNVDAGLAWHHRPEESGVTADIEAAYFRQQVENLIQFVQTSQFTIRAQNMNRSLIQGLEASARVGWKDAFAAYASYTFQVAKDDSSSPATSGKYLPGRPKHELAAGASVGRAWLPWFATKLFSDLNFMSGNYLDTQNLLSVNHRTFLSAGATLTFAKAIALTFTVKNLLNDLTEDVVGYPLPGRSYWGTVEFRI